MATLHEYIAQVHILLGAGSGHFSEPIVLHTGEDPRGFVVRDLDGDGRDDVAVWNRSSDSLSYFRSQGGGGFAPPLPLVQGEQLGGLAAGDVTGDGVADLLVPSMADGGRVMVLSRPGSVGGASLVLPAGTAFPSAVTTGDFDGDGAVDLAVTGEALTVQRGIGPGLFAAPTVVGTGLYLKGLVAGDLDRDGRDDLLTLGDNLEIHAGLADGGFAPPRIIPHNSGPTDLVLADFDADGLPDVVTEDDVDDNSDLSLLLRPLGSAPGVSRRVLVQATAAGGLTAGDLDGDGRLDLLVPSVSGGGVALIRNQGPFPNRPPRALPGAENVLECTGPDGARVTLDGRGSTDPDSTPQQQDLANFEWFEHFGEASQRLLADGAVATVTLPLGEHSLTLRVTDRAGASDAAEFLVDVVDTTAPAAGASMTPARLWPPNHQYTTVRANLAATDRCGPVRVTLVSAKSSEPDDLLGGADGSTRDDIAGAALGTADLEVLLRAERSGLGAGRTYTLTWRVEDGSGNAAEISADVLVPFSQSGGGLGVPPPHGTPGGGTSNGGSHGNGRPGGPKPHPSGRH
ncbi:MAG TPA: VCBS repeat-containing protein [Dongiaceae bacterium]|nr:VCBS repeat-containing protein [Dongiaceae bacterium]